MGRFSATCLIRMVAYLHVFSPLKHDPCHDFCGAAFLSGGSAQLIHTFYAYVYEVPTPPRWVFVEDVTTWVEAYDFSIVWVNN